MPDETRCALFVSYSKADVAWRDMFVRHLRESFAHDLLWVDRDSIDAGADGWESLRQAAHLAKAVLDLVEFDPNRRADRFLDHVDAHRQIGVTPEDTHAFRAAFVEDVIATGGRPAQGISAQTRGDAWNAVLTMGIDVMLRRVESATAVALA